jgi:2-C-methyl-D-erythritol 2,4-cyclodiphosphate synthase
MELLVYTMELIEHKGYVISNIDCTIVADEPKMMPHTKAMRETLAPVLQIDDDRISIKATRTEGVVFQGNGGIVVMASALLIKN